MQTRSDRRKHPADAVTARSVEAADSLTSTELMDIIREALGDRLRPSARIAEGGMGVLDLVLDRALERHVAIKRIHRDLADDAGTIRMFVREAQITGQLEHPNIVPVHELGIGADATPYFAMKLVEGTTLEDTIRGLPPGPLTHHRLLDLLDAVVRVCDALSFAHSRGVVHCDIKPANVMIGEFGQVYLMDWGIARRLGQAVVDTPREAPRPLVEKSGSTYDGGKVLIGTPTHMAPEQALGAADDISERTDVFLLGGLLFHLLARRAPFQGDNVWASITLAQTAACPPLAECAPWAPAPLVRIVERAMRPSPADRHPSVAAFRAELVAFVRGDGVFPTRSVAKGELVVREGDAADAAYIIETGRLEAYQGEGDGRRVLRTMGPSDVFGEMAILSPGPRTASVVALEDCLLRVVTAEALEREMDSLKPWMSAFVRTLARRFREREQAR